jgi:hypothetical protein
LALGLACYQCLLVDFLLHTARESNSTVACLGSRAVACWPCHARPHNLEA